MERTARIKYISDRLNQGHELTVAKVAARFEVSQKTIKRDIEYLRDTLRAPISYNTQRHSYEYGEYWDGLAFMDEHALLASAFIRAILNEFPYVPVLADDLVERFADIIPPSYERIVDCIRYELPELERPGDETTRAICQALRDDSCLEIAYTDTNGQESQRIIEPLRLVNYSGKWYCYAWDRLRQDVRNFLLSRMDILAFPSLPKSCPLLMEEIDTALSSSWGIYKGGDCQTATLRFTGWAAHALRTQVWHPDQVLVYKNPTTTCDTETSPAAAAPNSTMVELTLPVSNFTELLGRALRAGSQCEVLAPPEFRTRWQEEIAHMSRLAGPAP